VNAHGVAKQHGFTLLEVVVALFILAIIAVITAQGVHQRFRIADAEQRRGPMLLCAWEFEQRTALDNYWPSTGRHEGTLEQAGRTCWWRLDVSDTPIQRMRRGQLTLFDAPAREAPVLHFTLFLAPP
jgi:general secretion pathway protein I